MIPQDSGKSRSEKLKARSTASASNFEMSTPRARNSYWGGLRPDAILGPREHFDSAPTTNSRTSRFSSNWALGFNAAETAIEPFIPADADVDSISDDHRLYDRSGTGFNHPYDIELHERLLRLGQLTVPKLEEAFLPVDAPLGYASMEAQGQSEKYVFTRTS